MLNTHLSAPGWVSVRGQSVSQVVSVCFGHRQLSISVSTLHSSKLTSALLGLVAGQGRAGQWHQNDLIKMSHPGQVTQI